jgi:hypothetical protein
VKSLVVVSSVIANKPFNGGNARMVLNWLEGFKRLGADVYFIEQIRSTTCVDQAGAPAHARDSVNRAYFESVLETAGFGDRAALICDPGDSLHDATIVGATPAEIEDLARDADLLVNISGHLSLDPLKTGFRRKAYVDLDPGYTQIWHAQRSGAARLDGHDLYFTVGQRIGTAGCQLPTDGIPWQPIRQPIVIDSCRVSSTPPTARFTTIASWRGAYAPLTHGGATLGSKAHEFRRIAELPRITRGSFEVALDIHPGDHKDLNVLRTSGWNVVDPLTVAATPREYCDYIEASAAECSAAQGMYVQTKCGWFSDRTARYLASGKPVLVQDTGFCEPNGHGEGLLVFDSLADAARGVEQITRDYRAHSQAARRLAERYFDSSTQLGRVMDQAGLS